VSVEDLVRAWGGEELVVRWDEELGTWMLVGVHSTVLGPAMGGTRMKPYGSLEEAVRDVLRLSDAMTLKNALAGLPFGGGKAVLAVPVVPTGEARRTLMTRYGDLVHAVGGTYVTACDMNTTEADMDLVATRTPHVLGRSRSAGGSGSSGPDTAVGVFHGIRAVCRHVFGSEELAGRPIAIQGVGAVGAHLAGLLAGAGATLVVADVDPARAREVAGRTGATEVGADEILATPCDVLSPCATGGVLTDETIPVLACRAIAGAANNQLGAEVDAHRLQARGIVYVPDYAVNAGGVIHLAGYETLGWDDAQVAARLAGIDATVTDILETATGEGITTAVAAARLADQRISSSPG
jgi:glutamate dehydrogenase/leucine dehydrogenase